jgi:hypothetical protein
MKFSYLGHRSVNWLLHAIAVIVALATPAEAQLQPGGAGALYLFSDADLTDSTYQDQKIAVSRSTSCIAV